MDFSFSFFSLPRWTRERSESRVFHPFELFAIVVGGTVGACLGQSSTEEIWEGKLGALGGVSFS